MLFSFASLLRRGRLRREPGSSTSLESVYARLGLAKSNNARATTRRKLQQM
jgi:hypothetical protein